MSRDRAIEEITRTQVKTGAKRLLGLDLLALQVESSRFAPVLSRIS